MARHSLTIAGISEPNLPGAVQLRLMLSQSSEVRVHGAFWCSSVQQCDILRRDHGWRGGVRVGVEIVAGFCGGFGIRVTVGGSEVVGRLG